MRDREIGGNALCKVLEYDSSLTAGRVAEATIDIHADIKILTVARMAFRGLIFAQELLEKQVKA